MVATRNIGTTSFKGYTASERNAKPEYLSQPSVNCYVDEDGEAHARMGYEVIDIDLNQASKSARTYYQEQYDLTWFAVGTKVYYYNWTDTTLYDTGLTLTTGTITRFAEYAGDMYLTNTTDGLRRIVVGRLNDAAANSGDATVTVDTDLAARLSVFGITSGNLRINGTNEAFSSLVIATGVVTLTGTLSATYADNTIAIVTSDISSGREKASKIEFWKERMMLIGSENASNADQPNATVFFGKFASPTTLEDIINFTFGAGGSTREMVGKWGRITNILTTEDYLYVFKQKGAYVVNVADVVIATGGSTPELRTPLYGCLNEDSAADMGNGEIAYITSDKRIMRIKVSTNQGAPVVFPDESFDVNVQKLLRLMDNDQTGAHMKYHLGTKRLYVHVKIQAQWITLVFDNTIREWQPPQTGKAFADYFERKAIMYATDYTDDTVFQIDSSYLDNGAQYEVYICSSIFDVGNVFVDSIQVTGEITQPTTIYFKNPVTSDASSIRTIIGDVFSYGGGASYGSTSLGSQAYGGDSSDTGDFASYDETFGVFPSETKECQFISYCFGNSHWYSVKSYTITYRQFPDFNRST